MILDINLYNHRQGHSQILPIDFIHHLQTFAAHNHQHIEGKKCLGFCWSFALPRPMAKRLFTTWYLSQPVD